ncbi:MAG TPA: NADP-dependent oxidoreductase [Verrucomicrobiae bacterium]|nr:NADP-dependent oxidoreductase [Verrucomicrobiae bacterium]
MKAIYLNRKGGPEALSYGDIPKPEAGEDTVLVRVQATAVTPTELAWFPTFRTPAGGPRPFPIVLGHEFSGVVESVGLNVKTFRPGDAVYGMNDWFSNGAQAEYVVAPAGALARKPRLLEPGRAAAVPISALTAWQGLFEKAELHCGQSVLIHGASGGVGLFAVQLARRRGAHVIATASAPHLDFIRAMGAAEVIDYRATRFDSQLRDVDLVFDTIGGETLDRSWALLANGGRLVTIATSSASSADARVRDAFMLVRADGAELDEIGRLIDAGELMVFVDNVFPLADAPAAYERARRGGRRGKIVLHVAD